MGTLDGVLPFLGDGDLGRGRCGEFEHEEISSD
jgi:hypothetical protein